jgi:hypothetical protein
VPRSLSRQPSGPNDRARTRSAADAPSTEGAAWIADALNHESPQRPSGSAAKSVTGKEARRAVGEAFFRALAAGPAPTPVG